MQTLTDLLKDSSHGKLRGLALGACFDDIVALEGADFQDDRKRNQLIRYCREPSEREEIRVDYEFEEAS
ncbi:MAG: hypothetical protein ACPG4T_03230 [Nannocystaceae bacterium]